jgi:hypothetical protein
LQHVAGTERRKAVDAGVDAAGARADLGFSTIWAEVF